ncbi:MAG TPA: exodeoxyribonuclease V subunit beta, partial [Corynebacterium variabile]|nr:exodeoxyribonuclease V subunit beta [Corynebacterium variabile]
LVPESDFMDFLIASRDLVKGYFLMENPEAFDADSMEKFVDLTLPNGVPVRGFIDRVDVAPTGEVRVVDYKTGKKPIPRFAGQAMFQMRFYALVWWRLYDHIPEQLRLMYLKVRDDMVLSPTPAELNYVEKDLGRIWDAVGTDARSGNFAPKTSKLCGWCSFQKICPAFNGTPPEYPGVPPEFA